MAIIGSRTASILLYRVGHTKMLSSRLLFSVLLGFLVCSPARALDFVYHPQESMESVLHNIHDKCPNITRLYTIGPSVRGQELWVIEISDNPGEHELGEPEVKYMANMHGNEPGGRELLLQLANHLCRKYSRDRRVQRLVNNTRIHLMPCMNPDGFYDAWRIYNSSGSVPPFYGRGNANDVDLNRNFPDLISIFYENERTNGPNHHIQAPEEWDVQVEPEVRAVIRWIHEYPFVLSANLHEGELVANYPFDTSRNNRNYYTPSPDDELFRHLASTYANSHATMKDRKSLCQYGGASLFKDGITNGADWYSVTGSMQDYNYLATNCFDITTELSCIKFLPQEKLQEMWEDNREPLLKFMEQVHIGIKGVVRSTNGTAIEGAIVEVAGPRIGHDVTTAKDGDFWRLLLPAVYTVNFHAKGYISASETIIVKRGKSTWVHITLTPADADCVGRSWHDLVGNTIPHLTSFIDRLGLQSSKSCQGNKIQTETEQGRHHSLP